MSHELDMSLSEGIKNLLAYHRLSNVQFARIIDTHPVYISRILSTGRCGLVTKRKILRVFPELKDLK